MIKYFDYKNKDLMKNGFKLTGVKSIRYARNGFANNYKTVSNYRELAEIIKRDNTIIYSTKDLLSQNIMAFDLDIKDFGLNSNLVLFKDSLQLFIDTMADNGFNICFMYPTGSTFNKLVGNNDKTKKPVYNNKYVGLRFWLMLEELTTNNNLVYKSIVDDIDWSILPKIPFFKNNNIKLDPIFSKDVIFGSADYNNSDLSILGQDRGFYLPTELKMVKINDIDIIDDLNKTFTTSKKEFSKKQNNILDNYKNSNDYVVQTYMSNSDLFNKSNNGDHDDWVRLTIEVINKLVFVFNEKDEDVIMDLLDDNDWFGHRRSQVKFIKNKVINKIEWSELKGIGLYNSQRNIKNYLTNTKWSVSCNSINSIFKKEFIIDGKYLGNNNLYKREITNDDAKMKLIQAPTGTGKSNEIRDLLVNNDGEVFYLFILPYREQIKQNKVEVLDLLVDNTDIDLLKSCIIESQLDLDILDNIDMIKSSLNQGLLKIDYNKLENLKNIIVNLDETVMTIEDELVNLKPSIVCTLNKSSKYLSAITKQCPDKKIIIMVDEGHNLFTSIDYRLIEIKKLISNFNNPNIMVRVISASIPQIMFHQIGYNTALTVNFKFEDQYKPVNNKKTVFNSDVLVEINKVLSKGENVLVFIDNKSRLEDLRLKLKGVSSAVISSDTSKLRKDNPDRIILEKIKYGEDVSDIQVLLITSSLKEGIDIKDLVNRTVITNSNKITDIIQVNGRMRNFRVHNLVHIIEEKIDSSLIKLNRSEYFDYNKLITQLENDLFENTELVYDNLKVIKKNMGWTDEELFKNIYENNRILKSSDLVNYYKGNKDFQITMISRMAFDLLNDNITISNIDNELIDLGWNVEWEDCNNFVKVDKLESVNYKWTEVCELIKESDCYREVLLNIDDRKSFILENTKNLINLPNLKNTLLVSEMIVNNYKSLDINDKYVKNLFFNLVNERQNGFYNKIINHIESNNISKLNSDGIKELVNEFFTGDFNKINDVDKNTLLSNEKLSNNPIDVFKNFIPLTEIKRARCGGGQKEMVYTIDRDFLSKLKNEIK